MTSGGSEVACPQCGDGAAVIPIIYGELDARMRDLAAIGKVVMGGQAMYEDERDPTHFCTACDTSFRPKRPSPVA